MQWANDYVGIPFKDHGRTASGADCYGLVRLVLKEQFGIEVPDYTAYANSMDVDAVRHIFRAASQHASWKRVDIARAQPGDVIALASHSLHFGVIIGGGKFLHTEKGKNAVIESYGSVLWNSRIINVFRWCG